jgi:nucleotide-binding universal stress UspA family protein
VVSTENAAPGRSHLVVGVDGSPSSIEALKRAARMATALDADLLAIAAWSYPPMYGGSPAINWSPEDDARQILADSVKTVFGEEPPAWLHLDVHQGGAAQVLVEASNGAEMIIVGSRGHGGFAGLLLGSVSTAVAEHAHCPVLIYHGDTESVHKLPADSH